MLMNTFYLGRLLDVWWRLHRCRGRCFLLHLLQNLLLHFRLCLLPFGFWFRFWLRLWDRLLHGLLYSIPIEHKPAPNHFYSWQKSLTIKYLKNKQTDN